MVEVKSGETYYGVMKGVDKHMNIKLAEAYLTDKAGEHFHEISEVYIRGNTIKYFRMDPSTLQKIENTNYRCPQRWKEAQKRKSKWFIRQIMKIYQNSYKFLEGAFLACFRQNFWRKGVELGIDVGDCSLKHDFPLFCWFWVNFFLGWEEGFSWDFFDRGRGAFGFSLFVLLVILEGDCWRAEFFGCLIDRRPDMVLGGKVVDVGLNDSGRRDLFHGWFLGGLSGCGHGCLNGWLPKIGVGFGLTFLQTFFLPFFVLGAPLAGPHQPTKAEIRFLGFSFKHRLIQYYW